MATDHAQQAERLAEDARRLMQEGCPDASDQALSLCKKKIHALVAERDEWEQDCMEAVERGDREAQRAEAAEAALVEALNDINRWRGELAEAQQERDAANEVQNALAAERDEAVKAELDFKDAATEWMRKAKAAEAVLREIASYVDDGDRNDDIVSGYGLAKIARGFIDQPTKREMGVDAPDFGPTLGSNRGD